MTTDKNSHIIKYLDYYGALSKSPEFAIMLRGKWGSGKSWFIKKYLEDHARENFLYISLYGVTSYAEIEDAFFGQLHPFLASKGMKLAGKLLKGVIKTTIKIDLDDAKKDEVTLGGSLLDMRLPDYLMKLDGKTLVFDDLERCSIPIYEIMGYINQFVETNGMKVILIANEDEIIKLDDEEKKSDNSKRYLTIKEKLVGKSFEIEPDEDAALNDFIELVENDQCRDYLKGKTFLILLLFMMAGYKNLRHLKQALLDFDRFFELLDKEVKDCEDLMNHLFNLFLIISFEIKKGAIHEDDLAQLFSFRYLIKKDNIEKSKTEVVRSKYPIFQSFAFHPLSQELWTELFKAGTVDSVKLNKELKETSYLSKEEQPEWKVLYFFKSINDDELKNVFDRVYKEFSALTIDNPYVIIHITGISIFLCNNGLIDCNKDEIIEIGKKNLNSMKPKGHLNINNPSDFPGDNSDNLGYAGLDQPDFIEFIKYAAELVQQNEIDKQPVNAKEVMDLLKSSAKKFVYKFDINKPANIDYTRAPILKHIDVNEFADHLMNLSNSDKIAISDMLETRYSYSYNSRLQQEREWLQDLEAVLKGKVDAFKGKVSGFDLEQIILPGLAKSIARIPE